MNIENSTITPNRESDIQANKCDRIKACISAYLNKNPNLSLVNVEEKTSVPHSTLRRIMSGSGNPSPEAVIKIFLAFGLDTELLSYMKDYHPEIATIMANKSSHNQEFTFVDNTNSEYFSSEDYFAIITVAYTRSGTTEEEIQSEFGKVGVTRLHELLEKGILKKENNRFYGQIENYKLSFADTKRRIELAMRHYKLTEAGSINNWVSLQTESINEEGLRELKALQQKHYNERKELIFNNSLYMGNLKVYSATISSTLLTYEEARNLQ